MGKYLDMLGIVGKTLGKKTVTGMGVGAAWGAYSDNTSILGGAVTGGLIGRYGTGAIDELGRAAKSVAAGDAVGGVARGILRSGVGGVENVVAGVKADVGAAYQAARGYQSSRALGKMKGAKSLPGLGSSFSDAASRAQWYQDSPDLMLGRRMAASLRATKPLRMPSITQLFKISARSSLNSFQGMSAAARRVAARVPIFPAK